MNALIVINMDVHPVGHEIHRHDVARHDEAKVGVGGKRDRRQARAKKASVSFQITGLLRLWGAGGDPQKSRKA